MQPLRMANGHFETMDPLSLDSHVERSVIAKVKHAHATSPFFRWFYHKHGVDIDGIRTIADFKAMVPVTTKRDFLAFQTEHAGGELSPATRQVHLTSGTSGVGREIHERTQGDLAALGTGGGYEFIWAGILPSESILLTMPYTQTMAGPYFQAACEAAGAVPINSFSGSTEDRLAQLARFRCAGLVATPSYLHRLTLVARGQGLVPARDLPWLKAIFVSGEAYGLQWAGEAEKFWDARIFEGWGATQTLGVVMATCERGALLNEGGQPHRGVLHGLDHRCMIEVLDPSTGAAVEPGETGEIVITNLRASGLPCIRFKMGDRVRRLTRGCCPCGRHFSCFEAGTIGRLDDMIKVRGMNIWPSAVDEIVFAEPVTDYWGRIFTDQAGREMVELMIEPSAVPSDAAAFGKDLATRIRAKVGVAVEVKLIDQHSIGEVQFKARRWRDERVVLS